MGTDGLSTGGPASAAEQLTVPISAIEHFSYCPRQCALIHVDQTFEENVFTLRGQRAHERVHAGAESTSGEVRTLRAIPLWSDRLGLIGKADAVEVGPAGPFPVEYKVGKRRGAHADLQLCAQALCLEEMLDVTVSAGALFYWATGRRHVVAFDPQLRHATTQIIDEIRRLFDAQQLPAAPNDERCPRCSLINACLPDVVASPHRLRGLQGALFAVADDHG